MDDTARKELHHALLTGGLLNPPIQKHHELWKAAIEGYKKSTGDHEVSLECGGCVNKIKKWLAHE